MLLASVDEICDREYQQALRERLVQLERLLAALQQLAACGSPPAWRTLVRLLQEI
ncbi:MAG TPA: hypothetical protein VHL79_24455 [Ramlibacter sp.]|jgi:hypothetical protein|nr:hypothetical protein [Ramlibacter sp.]